jgi:hypothetical protein
MANGNGALISGAISIRPTAFRSASERKPAFSHLECKRRIGANLRCPERTSLQRAKSAEDSGLYNSSCQEIISAMVKSLE